MGLAERDYYREPAPPGFQMRTPRSMVTTLVIINVALYLFDYLFTGSDHWLTSNLLVKPEYLAQPWMWWTFITSGFAHSPDYRHILFNMFGLWMFGRDVEAIYGPKEFLRIYLTAVILGTLIWTSKVFFLVDPALWPPGLLGASGAVTAVILLFCIHYPKRTILLMMVIPAPAWVLGVIVILMNIFQVGAENVAYDVHMVGAIYAIIYYKSGWSLGSLFRFKSPSRSLTSAWKGLKRRPKLRVHSPGEQYRQLDQDADSVLDKLHNQGEESLSPSERRILEDYSRRMRQKHS